MSVTTQGFSSFSSDAVTYIAEKTLMIAKKAVVFQQLGDKVVLPENNSKTFQYTRYDRLNLPSASLTDGTTPDNTSMSISTVTAVADQWGAYVNLSDVAQLTIKHPVMVKAIDLMGYQAAETYDREIINVLLAGTSVVFPAAVATRAGLGSTDYMTTAVVRKAVSGLRDNGAVEYDGTDYVGVVDPFVEMDLSADSTFQTAASYSNIKVLQNGEIGRWMGVRWMRSNLIPRLTAAAAVAATSPASPAGTFTTANYRISVAEYDIATGFLTKLYQNDAVAFTNLDSAALTTPNVSGKMYKVFVGAAGGGATASLFQGVETTYGTGFIPLNTAISIVDPPSSGASIAGSDIPANAIVVHFSWVIGKEAYAVVDLQKIQTYVTPNQASDSDPLVQRRKAGWKFFAKSVICNQNFLKRIESASAFS
jgi:N4-gp56 family major capsid protein